MPFTLLMLLAPLLILSFAGRDPVMPNLAMFGALWLLADVPILGVYWLARVVRRAWRDGDRRVPG